MEQQQPSFPLNIIKEKITLSLPQGTTIDNSAVVFMSNALKEFLINFSQNIYLENSKNSNEKKLLIKDIKETIEKYPQYAFLQLLIENSNKQ